MSEGVTSVQIALPTRCALGEGLHWDWRRNLLWFVDIHGPYVYWLNPDTGEHGRRALPESVGWVLSVQDSERMLVGLKSGIALLDAFDESAQIEWIDRRFPAHVGHRLNDGKADSHGRLWYGSLSAVDESQSVGRLACYEFTAAAPAIIDRGYKVPNGPAFNRNCSVMLHSDSARRITYRYDIDISTGAVVRRTIWRQFSEEEGCPDGMSFDSEECVWIAHWGAAVVCRYDIHGNRLSRIQMPVRHVTNVCFAGRDMNRMFVTSAAQCLDETQDDAQPSAGALFEISGVHVRGLPPWPLRIRHAALSR